MLNKKQNFGLTFIEAYILRL